MNSVLVSVIIPVFNREKTVETAVNSVLKQTIHDLEVIIVDDGSTDNTASIIKNIHDDRIKYYYQKNQGACLARNYGISKASGKYIAFHDSDDIWHKEKLERQIEIFEICHPDLVFCKLNQIRNDGIIIKLPEKIPEGFVDPIVNLFGIGTQTIVAKREIFEQFEFDPSLPRFQEFELLYRIAQRYRLYCLDQGLVDYYIGNDSISSNPAKVYEACSIIYKRHPELKREYPVMTAKMADNLQMAGNQLRLQKNNDYNKYFLKARELDGSLKCYFRGILLKCNLYNIYLHYKLKKEN